MNVIELLMFEHAAIRVHFRHITEKNTDLLLEVDDFISNCHTKMEDTVLFPYLLRKNFAEAAELRKFVEGMKDEHTVIRMTGDSLRSKVSHRETILRDEVDLYSSAVESHNASEEAHILLRCMELGIEIEKKVTEEAEDVIRAFGIMKYLQATGLSLELLNALK